LRKALRAALALLAFAATGALSQDYDREKRWSEEIMPALVVGDAVWIEGATGRKFLGIYALVKHERGAVVLVHGVGVHPDHGMIGILRTKLTDLGYTTLSIQMPVLAADQRGEDYYPALFPEALDRIGKAAAWMRSRGHQKLSLLSHSMGSWMANEYFDATPQSPYLAWACLGLTGGYTWPTYFSRRPILDVYGENDLPVSTQAAWRRRATLATTVEKSRQVMIAGADHFYARKEDEVARLIADWLSEAP
jgi:alpha/beta superfamily hydrolase